MHLCIKVLIKLYLLDLMIKLFSNVYFAFAINELDALFENIYDFSYLFVLLLLFKLSFTSDQYDFNDNYANFIPFVLNFLAIITCYIRFKCLNLFISLHGHSPIFPLFFMSHL